MPDRRVSVILPTGPAEGVEVHVDESIERWSEFKMQDGSTIRVKVTLTTAVRVDDQFDQSGNPMYSVNMAPVVVVDAPDHLRRKVQ
jgi:hypothetical protein